MTVYTNNEMRNLKIKEAVYILRERYLEFRYKARLREMNILCYHLYKKDKKREEL